MIYSIESINQSITGMTAKDERITIRIKKKHKAKLQAEAEKLGISLSKLITNQLPFNG